MNKQAKPTNKKPPTPSGPPSQSDGHGQGSNPIVSVGVEASAGDRAELPEGWEVQRSQKLQIIWGTVAQRSKAYQMCACPKRDMCIPMACVYLMIAAYQKVKPRKFKQNGYCNPATC